MAKIEYEMALSALEKTSPGYDESEARLQDKLRQAKEALALEHRRTGENLMEQEYYDDARELFQLAIELTQDPELISTIENRMLEMKRLTARDIQTDVPNPQVNDEAVSHEQKDEYLSKACDRLKAARPTAVNLFWGVDRVYDKVCTIENPAERIDVATTTHGDLDPRQAVAAALRWRQAFDGGGGELLCRHQVLSRVTLG